MRRTTRLAVIAVVAAWALAACGVDYGESDAGYVSGDGTVKEWVAAERGAVLEMSGTDFAGESVDIAELRGDIVVINTWYASCPPCRAEADDLVALDAREGVTVVGVNNRDDAGAAQAFERTFGVEYPSINDADGKAIAALQGIVAVNAVPTTLVLDAQGRVAARVIGRAEPSTLNAIVDALIAEARA